MQVEEEERHRKLQQQRAELAKQMAAKSGETKQRVMQALESNERMLQAKKDQLRAKLQQQADRMANFGSHMQDQASKVWIILI